MFEPGLIQKAPCGASLPPQERSSCRRCPPVGMLNRFRASVFSLHLAPLDQALLALVSFNIARNYSRGHNSVKSEKNPGSRPPRDVCLYERRLACINSASLASTSKNSSIVEPKLAFTMMPPTMMSRSSSF